MKNIPVYENLDTSFVNLSALIRHLRERQFLGELSISLRGYEAKITFSEAAAISVEEHDSIAGRIAEGEEALQRLLIRAREPGGVINVYKTANVYNPAAAPQIPEQRIESATERPIAKPVVHPVVQKEFLAAPTAAPMSNGNGRIPEKALPIELPIPTPPPPGPLPFELTNRVEERARQSQISEQDWQILLKLVGELLGAIDQTLAASGLDFANAFAGARTEISGDYPFLSPSSDVFVYSRGRVGMTKKINAKLFAASINETLRRILDNLASEQRFENAYRDVTHKILALIHHNKSIYDKFAITPHLERILGV